MHTRVRCVYVCVGVVFSVLSFSVSMSLCWSVSAAVLSACVYKQAHIQRGSRETQSERRLKDERPTVTTVEKLTFYVPALLRFSDSVGATC